MKLEGEVRLCALVDVELGDKIDLHPTYLACTVRHAVHELAEGPAEVLEAHWKMDVPTRCSELSAIFSFARRSEASSSQLRSSERGLALLRSPRVSFRLFATSYFSYKLRNLYFYNGHARG